MKKFYFLFLFALIASISNLYAAEKTVTWNFQQSERLANGEICKDKVATTTGAVGAWTVNSTGKTYVAGCGTPSLGSGIQLGSGRYSFNGSLALSGAEIPEGATVKKVSFFVASNGSNYSCSMSINGSTVGNTLKIGKKRHGRNMTLVQFLQEQKILFLIYQVQVKIILQFNPSLSLMKRLQRPNVPLRHSI